MLQRSAPRAPHSNIGRSMMSSISFPIGRPIGLDPVTPMHPPGSRTPHALPTPSRSVASTRRPTLQALDPRRESGSAHVPDAEAVPRSTIEARLRAELDAIAGELRIQQARATEAPTAQPPAAGRVLFMGHGNYDPDELRELGKPLVITVPEGTSLTVYAPHGAMLEGAVIESVYNERNPGDLFQVTYRSGDVVPNYLITHDPTLEPFVEPDPHEREHFLRELPGDVYEHLLDGDHDNIVLPLHDRFLGDLLVEGMGSCHWLTCLAQDDHPNIDLVSHPEGVFDMTTKQRVDPRTLPGFTPPEDPPHT